MTELDSIRDTVTSAARSWLLQAPDRTPQMKAAAAELVRARGLLATSDGVEDVAGRSGAYRALIATALDAAAVPRHRRSALLSALRHHITSALRATYSEEILAQYGIGVGDATERLRASRRVTRDRTAWITRTGPAAPDDVLAFTAAATEFLDRLRPRDLTDEHRARLLELTGRLHQMINQPDRT